MTRATARKTPAEDPVDLTGFVTYDRRLATAAERLDLEVFALA